MKLKLGIRDLMLLSCLLMTFNHLSAQQKPWSLADCIAYACKNNVVLNQQKLTSETSKVNLDQARANRLPNLNFTDAQTFNFGNTIYGSQVVNKSTNSNDPSLTSSVLLFGGFKYINLVKENKLNYDASVLDIQTQKNNLALNVTAAYVQVLYEYDAITIAQRQIEADSVQVNRMAKFVAVGQTPEDSLYQIEAQLATDKATLVSTQNQLDLSNLQLEQLMELPLDPAFVVEQPVQKELHLDVPVAAAEIYKMAENILPDEKSAALKTKAFETDLEVNRAALLPILSLTGGLSTEYYSALTHVGTQTVYQNQTIGYLQSNPSELVSGPVPVTSVSTGHYPFFTQFKDNFGQLIALNLSVPIFNNFKARNNIKLAKIAVENARLNEQAVKNNLRKNVEQAYTDQVTALKNYLATKEQLVAQTRSYTDMHKKLNVGLASVTEFLIEENNYYKSVFANLQARYEYIFKTKVVEFYTGSPLTY